MNTVHRIYIPPTVLPDNCRSKQGPLAGTRPQVFVCNYRRNPLSHPTELIRTAVRAFLIVTAMIFATSAKAKLGETVSQLTKRFGHPYENSALDVGRMAYSFHEHGYDVEVVVENDRSVQETYYSSEPLQPNGDPPNAIVRGILQTNVPGAKWKDAEMQGHKEVAAFVTADGKYRADIFLDVDRPGSTVSSTFTVQVCTSDYLAKSVQQERGADATPTAKTAQSTPSQQGSTVPNLQGNEADKERGIVKANPDIREPSTDSVPVNAPPNNTEVRDADTTEGTDTEIVYTDPDYEAFRKLTKGERTAAEQSMSKEEIQRIWLFLYKGRDEQGKPILYTAAERKVNAVLYSQACNIAMRKLREQFVRKLALDDPDGNTDSFVTKVVERAWGPTGRPRDWKDSNPPPRWITQYKNVTFKVEPDQLTEVDRMNGWRWRCRVRFSAKYMRIFSGMNATYFGESTSGQLRPGEWKASRGFLDVSLENRDEKWAVSVSPYDMYLEYGKPSEAEMKEYDAAAEGTRSR